METSKYLIKNVYHDAASTSFAVSGNHLYSASFPGKDYREDNSKSLFYYV